MFDTTVDSPAGRTRGRATSMGFRPFGEKVTSRDRGIGGPSRSPTGPVTRPPAWPGGAAEQGRLDGYLRAYADLFPSPNARLWAGVYLRGLLDGTGRKCVESLAREARLPDDEAPPRSPAQALQRFISGSPWCPDRVTERYRSRMAAALAPGEGGAVVLADVSFRKRGNHSVGVFRQYSASSVRKENCQSAVLAYFAGPGGGFPLALRLYLPDAWAGNPGRLERAGVPPEARRPLARWEIALGLIDAARASGVPVTRVVPGPGYGKSEAYRIGLSERGLTALDPEGSGDTAGADSSGPRAEASDGIRTMVDDLGLGHFEGRSWGGFHRHACMVMLAYGFLALGAGERSR